VSALSGLLIAFIALSGAGALLSLLLRRKAVPGVVTWIGMPAGVALAAAGAIALFASAPSEATLWHIASIGDVIVRVDSLAGLFLLVSGVVIAAVSLFAADSLPQVAERYSSRPYGALYFTLLASIAWILISGDVFSFLVAWEIMSIACYLLVNHEHEDDENTSAGYLLLAMGEAGALAAALGLLLLAASAGSLDFAALRTAGGEVGSGLHWAIFLLTFFGFGVKAGLVPVNGWLPRAYTAAPAPFVPLLAGATLNLGLYGILRVNADLLPPVSVGPGLVALVIGSISALVGILYATTENDLKTLLGHSSIENAGIITAGLGMGLTFGAAGHPVLAAVGFLVALYHLTNHSLYKTLLFVGSGAVADRAGSRDLDRLGGLIRRMPWTALLVLAGVLGIAAMPPFNGFVSEWLTLQTLLRCAELSSAAVKVVFVLCGAGLALTAALAVTCFAKVFAMGFLGVTRSEQAASASEAGALSRASMALLAAACLALGVLPTYAIGALNRAVKPLAHANAARALVPPFFAGSAGHDQLPKGFVADFHALGAQVGQSVAPGPGLVILHRGGVTNPVVFAASPTWLIVVLIGLLLVTWLVVRVMATRRRTAVRRASWDGGIRRLLPEMTYTATGFSNPVRVVFQAIFRPTTVEDTRETVAEHFRTAIRRTFETVYIIDSLVIVPVRKFMFAAARRVARIHHGRLNAYMAYGLIALIAVLVIARLF
jgi:hydrogenase-4 component B